MVDGLQLEITGNAKIVKAIFNFLSAYPAAGQNGG